MVITRDVINQYFSPIVETISFRNTNPYAKNRRTDAAYPRFYSHKNTELAILEKLGTQNWIS